MADIEGLKADPAFQALDFDVKKRILSNLDPLFKNVSDETVFKYLKPGKESPLTGVSGSVLGDVGSEVSASLPFRGAPAAFSAGYQTGQDVLGENLAGKALGTLFGGAMGLGTVANPLTKGLAYYPKVAQASGEQIASSVLGGGQGLPTQTLLGQREILPDLQASDLAANVNVGNDTLNDYIQTALNTGTDIGTQIVKDPLNALFLAAGLTSPQAKGAYKTLPTSIANTLKAPIEGVRRLPTSTEYLSSFVTDAPKQGDIFQTRLNSGAFEPAIQDIARAKTGSGVEGVKTGVKKLNQETYDIVDPTVKAYNPNSPLFESESLLTRAQENLSTRIRTPEVAERALKPLVRDYLTKLTPDNILGRYRDVSDQLINFWKSPDQAKYANKTKALEAVRETLSDNVKTILDEGGFDPQVWSKHGMVNEFGNNIFKNYGQALSEFRSKQGEGILSKKGEGEGLSLRKIPGLGTATRVTSNLIERYKGGVPELLNKRTDQLFAKTTPSEAPFRTPTSMALESALTPDEVLAAEIQRLVQEATRRLP